MAEFETKEQDGLLIITMPASIGEDMLTTLDQQTQKWVASATNIHVLDFAQTQAMSNKTYRHFILYNQTLRSAKKALFCINLNEKMNAQFKQDGLTATFVAVANLEEAKKKASSEKPSIDVTFINPFVTATCSTLETQANTKLTPGKPYLKKSDDAFPIEIAGVISLSAPQFKGSISICFKGSTFLKIYENMVGEAHKTITPEIQDAAGEILNMIYGQAKVVLNDQKGYSLEKAIPTVLIGENLKIRHQSRATSIVLPFDSAAGPMIIEILVEKS